MTPTTTDQFQQRRALDIAVEALEKTSSEGELVQGAYAIADEYPFEMVMSALLRRLDTPSSQLRGGLARIATFLPAEETLQALQEYALNRANPAQGRVTSAMIVERFLGGALRPGTLSDLQGNEDAALQSLHDAVSEGEEDPAVLVDYVTQMQEYDPNIAMQVMHHLDALAPQLRVGLLRLIATDARVQVARTALGRLETLAQSGDPSYPQGANTEGSLRARRALYVLAPNLPPELAKIAETALRKLQFRSMGYTPSQEHLRCFLALPHFSSAQAIEFWQFDHVPMIDLFYLAVTQQTQGIVASDLDQVRAPKAIRKSKGTGSVIKRKEDGEESLQVEIPAATGRVLIERAVQWMLAEKKQLPAAYLECMEWLWDAPRPTIDQDVIRYLDGEGTPLDVARGAEVASKLLMLKGLEFWDLAEMVRSGTMRQQFRRADRQEAAQLFAGMIKDQGIDTMMAQQFEAALRLLALWLHYAGDEQNAANALNLAVSQRLWTLEENPLIPALFAER